MRGREYCDDLLFIFIEFLGNYFNDTRAISYYNQTLVLKNT